MALFAIGDVQGCYEPLLKLLDQVSFDPDRDKIWFTGDLVNRGPASLEVLRFVYGLGAGATTVLGNHDLHLLAIADGRQPVKRRDTFTDILAAPDRDELLAWLRHRPLFTHDATHGCAMVHAGLLPQWDFATAASLAREVESVLRGDGYGELFANMYGDTPDHWHDDLGGWERLRVIINAMTRLRYCDADGRMHLKHKGAPGSQPDPLRPWFQVTNRRSADTRLIFGHWSTLGLHIDPHIMALDTGCVWGGHLSAVRLDTPEADIAQYVCAQAQDPRAPT